MLFARNVARQNNEDASDAARLQFDSTAAAHKFLPQQLVLLDEHSFLGKIKNWHLNGLGHTKFYA
jgi:hypothetical protein